MGDTLKPNRFATVWRDDAGVGEGFTDIRFRGRSAFVVSGLAPAPYLFT